MASADEADQAVRGGTLAEGATYLAGKLNNSVWQGDMKGKVVQGLGGDPYLLSWKNGDMSDGANAVTTKVTQSGIDQSLGDYRKHLLMAADPDNYLANTDKAEHTMIERTRLGQEGKYREGQIDFQNANMASVAKTAREGQQTQLQVAAQAARSQSEATAVHARQVNALIGQNIITNARQDKLDNANSAVAARTRDKENTAETMQILSDSGIPEAHRQHLLNFVRANYIGPNGGDFDSETSSGKQHAIVKLMTGYAASVRMSEKGTNAHSIRDPIWSKEAIADAVAKDPSFSTLRDANLSDIDRISETGFGQFIPRWESTNDGKMGTREFFERALPFIPSGTTLKNAMYTTPSGEVIRNSDLEKADALGTGAFGKRDLRYLIRNGYQ
jgi:hypothetical protein